MNKKEMIIQVIYLYDEIDRLKVENKNLSAKAEPKKAALIIPEQGLAMCEEMKDFSLEIKNAAKKALFDKVFSTWRTPAVKTKQGYKSYEQFKAELKRENFSYSDSISPLLEDVPLSEIKEFLDTEIYKYYNKQIEEEQAKEREAMGVEEENENE